MAFEIAVKINRFPQESEEAPTQKASASTTQKKTQDYQQKACAREETGSFT